MKRMILSTSILAAAIQLAGVSLASDAATSATVGSGPGGGAAGATARYEGDRGFARTDTRTGRVNEARGVAVGVDENGLSLSISNAITAPNGVALATNFNLSIDRDGDVSHSGGIALAAGPIERSASAGGSAGNGRAAVSQASGRTDPRGIVRAVTRAESTRRPVDVRRVIRVR
ncbi:MAG: hypothetical protein U1D55_15535 [Phycisphaerae bacterium]